MKTFWDIEREKTRNIFILFIFLFLLYFLTFFAIFFILKLFSFLVRSLEYPHLIFRIYPSEIFTVFLIALIIAIVHWYYSNKNVVDKIMKLLGARHPDKKDHYHYIFENVVDEICSAAGGIDVKRCIVPTGAMNAFALGDLKGRRVIGITEGLVSRLTRDEIQSVVAHEMAHIVSGDCVLTTVASSLFGVFNEILERFNKAFQKIKESSEGDSIFWGFNEKESRAVNFLPVAIPVFILLFTADIMGQLFNMFISREKEYRADASAIKYTRNPLPLASALYKIATHWRGNANHLSPIFILSPQSNPLEEREDFWSNLFSTHPPLTKRLQIILNISHADICEIYKQIKKYKGMKEEQIEEKVEPLFYVEKDDKWLGPFTLLQLQTIDGLSPDTRIRPGETGEIILADAIPALNHFFKLRKEPIWKIRRLCPICREWLVVQKYEGLYLWRCAFCNGILVEKDKLPRIFVRREKGFSEMVKRTASILLKEAKSKKKFLKLVVDNIHKNPCPRCGKAMIRRFYSYAYHVEIDLCAACNLIWFDKDELEILQFMIEKEGE